MDKKAILDAIGEYGNDIKSLLRHRATLDMLYTFSPQAENILEWLDIRQGARVLQVGASEGRLTGLLLRRGCHVTIYDRDPLEGNILEARYAEALKERSSDGVGITFVCEDIFEKYSAQGSSIDSADAKGYTKDARYIGHEEKHDDGDTAQVATYDYIIAIGNIPEPLSENIAYLKSLLSSGGVLIIGCANPYGIKYISGVDRPEHTYSKKKLLSALEVAGFDNPSIYYPYPNLILPHAIYSDRRMPIASELYEDMFLYDACRTDISDIKSFVTDICEDGLFAEYSNAYLAICGSKPDVDFVKYNRTRIDRYATCVEQRTDADGRYIIKRALYPEGAEHIRSFEKGYHFLSDKNPHISYVRPQISEDSMSCRFRYVQGISLAQAATSFTIEEIKTTIEKLLGQQVYDYDMLFSNFIIEADSLASIDYEWICEDGIQMEYAKYRILEDLYKADIKAFRDYDSFDDVLVDFGLDVNSRDRWIEMEQAFQWSVFEDMNDIYIDPYRVDVIDRQASLRILDEHARSSRKISSLKAELDDSLRRLSQTKHTKHLTNDHVKNLETIIEDLRAEHRKVSELASRYRRLSLASPLLYIDKAIKKLTSGRKPSHAKKYDSLAFPAFDDIKVSIVIPCYNEFDYTYECLGAILEYTKDIAYEIIIADDMSTDETRDIERYAQNITVSRTGANMGFLKNCNQAATKARGKYIMFLNNDTKVTEGYLYWLAKLLDEDDSIGMTGSKLVYPDGRLQEAGGIIWSDGSGWNYGRMMDPTEPEYNYVKDVDYISGAAILIRRNLWESIGGFDERYAPAYCEDADLAFEVRRAGYRVVYQPKSQVIHFEGVSCGTDVNGTGTKSYQVANMKKLYEKWQDVLSGQYDNVGTPDPYRARERSKGRKIILFIDHYVPTYDKDAGSRTVWQYLQMLVKKGFVVKFVGANFLSEEPYTSDLQQLGIEVLYGTRMQDDIKEYIYEHRDDFHLVFINRPHIAVQYINFIQAYTNLKVIYYGHDLHFMRLHRQYELCGDRQIYEDSRRWKDIELDILRKADVSYYPSVLECDEIKQIDPTINVKPITAYIFDDVDAREDDFANRQGLLFVGGFAHQPNVDAMKWLLENAWKDIHKQLGVNITIVGSHAEDEIAQYHNEQDGIIVKGYVSDDELAELYRSARLAVIPLRYGAGVKGKVVEAMYHGLPIVTTAVGGEGIPDSSESMVIADEESFAMQVVRTYGDISKLGRLQQRGYQNIRENYSTQAVWNILKDELE